MTVNMLESHRPNSCLKRSVGALDGDLIKVDRFHDQYQLLHFFRWHFIQLSTLTLHFFQFFGDRQVRQQADGVFCFPQTRSPS